MPPARLARPSAVRWGPLLLVTVELALLGAMAWWRTRLLPPPVTSDAGADCPWVRAEVEGARLSLRLEEEGGEGCAPARGGRPLRARLQLEDAREGGPLSGRAPLVWLVRREAGAGPPGEEACRARVRSFLGGMLSAQADADLNTFLLLALNQDGTLSVINPQVALQRTKLRALVELGGRGEDWALHPDRRTLFVSLPEEGRVAVVDLTDFRVAASLEVGGRPTALLLSPQGHQLWVADEARGVVHLVDTQRRERVQALPLGSGRVSLALSGEGRTLWAVAAGEGRVRAWDTATLALRGEARAGPGASGLAVSALAGQVYVASSQEGRLTVLEEAGARPRPPVVLEPGLSTVRLSPEGRWAFVPNPSRAEVSVVDVASGRRVHRLEGLEAVEDVFFSAHFAYLRHRTQPSLTLVALEGLGRAQPPAVVRVAFGQRAPAEAGGAVRAAPLAQLPAGEGVVGAQPADRTLLVYREGMMAPVGTYLAYGRQPLAVLVVDRTLREEAPGVYATGLELPRGGTYDAAVLLDAPRGAVCLPLEVEGREEGAPRPPALVPLLPAEAPLSAGRTHPLRFRVEGVFPPPRPEEVQVLLFRPPGTWQWRGAPQPGTEGALQVDFTPPGPGLYRMLVGLPGRGVALGTLPPLTLAVEAADDSPLSRLPAP